MEAFGVTEDDLPAIGIQYTYNDADDKYLLAASDVTSEKVLEFVDTYFAGNLQPIATDKEEL